MKNMKALLVAGLMLLPGLVKAEDASKPTATTTPAVTSSPKPVATHRHKKAAHKKDSSKADTMPSASSAADKK